MAAKIKKIEKKQKDSIAWRIFWRELWHILKPFKKLFSAISSFIVMLALLDLAAPYILKLLIDGLHGFDAANLIFLAKLIVLYLATSQVHSVLDYFADRWILRLLVKIEYDL